MIKEKGREHVWWGWWGLVKRESLTIRYSLMLSVEADNH